VRRVPGHLRRRDAAPATGDSRQAEREDRDGLRRHLHQRRVCQLAAVRAGQGEGVMRRVEQVMGTAVSLHLADPLPQPQLARLADEVFAWLHEVDRRFSTYKEDSEVNRVHRGELDPAAGSADLRTVLGVGPDLGLADAHATAAQAMGRAGLDWLAALDGYESGVVTEDGEAYRSPGLPVAR